MIGFHPERSLPGNPESKTSHPFSSSCKYPTRLFLPPPPSNKLRSTTKSLNVLRSFGSITDNLSTAMWGSGSRRSKVCTPPRKLSVERIPLRPHRRDCRRQQQRAPPSAPPPMSAAAQSSLQRQIPRSKLNSAQNNLPVRLRNEHKVKAFAAHTVFRHRTRCNLRERPADFSKRFLRKQRGDEARRR